MRRWLLTIEYDGTAYRGWQSQPDAPTVQSTVEAVLSRIHSGADIRLVGQGRTDSGVHALGQTAHVDLPIAMGSPNLPDPANPPGNPPRIPIPSEEFDRVNRLMASANRMLPPDIHIRGWQPVDDALHARFDALSRQYAYHVRLGLHPLSRRHEHQIPLPEPSSVSSRSRPRPLEAPSEQWTTRLPRLDRMAQYLLGEHDFSGFCPPDPTIPHFRCTIEQAEWQRDTQTANRLVFRVRANRFLRHMVRRLVGTMLDASADERGPEAFRNQLDPGNTPVGTVPRIITAPPQGLILENVLYPARLISNSLDRLEE